MAQSVSTHLMFEGTAEEAMNLYTSVFPGSRITEIERYEVGDAALQGKVKLARFELVGRSFICIDSPVKHAFTFTPSISLFVECESRAELDTVFARLSEGGSVLMPLDNYGFSTRFGWLADRFGVSWQLNLR
jgi:predicted 3-demethylubiquinone-9 3-methyltransferase (glyoxalase superfamily)